MKKLLYTGSFDPLTWGHIELIKRAYNLCDQLYVGVGVNVQKAYTFTIQERVQMIKEWAGNLAHLEVIEVPGLTADKAKELECDFLVRGVRSNADFDREMQIAQINQELHYIDTILLPAVDHGFVSSSAVKELAMLGAGEYELKKFVPEHVARALIAKRTAVTDYLKTMKQVFEASLEESTDIQVQEAANKGLALVNETLGNMVTKS